jgi:hypothetical protein
VPKVHRCTVGCNPVSHGSDYWRQLLFVALPAAGRLARFRKGPLHLRMSASLHSIGEKEHVLTTEMGELLVRQPNHRTPCASLANTSPTRRRSSRIHSTLLLVSTVGCRNEHMPSELQPSHGGHTLPNHRAHDYTTRNARGWGRGMLGMQRASQDSVE